LFHNILFSCLCYFFRFLLSQINDLICRPRLVLLSRPVDLVVSTRLSITVPVET